MRTSLVLYNSVFIKEPKTPGTTWNHLKNARFVPKMIFFTKWAKNLKMGTSSKFPYNMFNIMEPKTPGTTWNHLKKCTFCSQNDLFSLSGLKI